MNVTENTLKTLWQILLWRERRVQVVKETLTSEIRRKRRLKVAKWAFGVFVILAVAAAGISLGFFSSQGESFESFIYLLNSLY